MVMNENFQRGFEKTASIKSKLKNLLMSPKNKKRLIDIKDLRSTRDTYRNYAKGSKNPLSVEKAIQKVKGIKKPGVKDRYNNIANDMDYYAKDITRSKQPKYLG